MKTSRTALSALNSARKKGNDNFTDAKKSINKMTQDEINELKIQISMLEQETKQIKSKITRIRQQIKDRNSIVEKATSFSNDKQTLKSSMRSTLEFLKKTVESLENTLIQQRDEYVKLSKSDKLTKVEELQVELQMYYLEHRRLLKQVEQMKLDDIHVNEKLDLLRKKINSTKLYENNVNNLQVQVDELTEKLFAYSKSEMRISASRRLKDIIDNPSSYNEIKQEIENEIEQEKAKITNNRMLIEQIHKQEEENVQYLQNIIDEHATKVRAMLDQKQ